ncbi:MAG: DUF362 domain-containing protein [Bacillota bacterium]|nr:DUF362 domain-containing protein [Bacillota bacterium]
MPSSNNPRVVITHRESIPGTPGSYTNEELAVVYEMVRESVDILGGIDSIIKPGDKVVVKINAGVPTPADKGYDTDPRVLEAVIKLIKEETKAESVKVIERSASYGDTSKSLEVSGLKAAAERAGVDEIINLQHVERVSVQVPKPEVLFEPVMLPRCLLEADRIIYIPKMKVHKLTQVSLSMKLSQGLLAWSDIHRNHRTDIDQKMADLLQLIKPDLIIMDALWPTQGQGPVSPFPDDLIKDFNVIIAGTDSVAVDTVASTIMGFEPLHEIPMIRTASMLGLGEGSLEKIEVLGTPIEKVKRNFRRGNIDLAGIHPKVKAYYGSACKGCIHLTRTSLDSWLAIPENLKQLEQLEQLTFIIGPRTTVPDNIPHNPPHSYTFVIGDCACEHKNKGIFLPGCTSWSIAQMDFIGKTEEELVDWYLKRYPGVEKDENQCPLIP